MALPSLALLWALCAAAGQHPDAAQATFEAYAWRAAPSPPGAAEVWRSLGGAIVQRGEERGELLESGLALGLFNAAGRDDLHLERDRAGYAERWQRWFDTRDPALLVREPCLTDPDTRARLQRNLAATLAAPDLPRLAWIALGDEVSLTPHGAPGDVCLSATCRRAWERFLALQDGLDDAQRRALADPERSSTDRARAALADGDLAALHGWLLRRRFQAALLEGTLLGLARQARTAAPDVPLALLGLAVQSPFGTPRIEHLPAELGVLEAYRESDARELLLTLRGPSARILQTVFPQQEPVDRVIWSIWEHALQGGDGVVLWDDRALARAPELAARVNGTLADVRRVRKQMGGARLGPGRVALVHDFESLCLDWLGDALLDGQTWPKRFASHQLVQGTWESGAAGWLQLARDCGQLPGAVPLEDVGAHTAQRFGLLLLSELSVLDERELQGLEAYLDAGGHLLVSGTLGRCDSRGVRAPRPAWQRLRAAAPERVVVVEGRPADYLGERRLRTPRARAWRERARAWFDAAGVPSPPWELAPGGDDLPWLQSWTRTPDGDVIGAVLPGWRDIEGNAPLGELMLGVRARSGAALEWLHPLAGESEEGARLLRAGEAAVFRIPGGR